MSDFQIRLLKPGDIQPISVAFAQIGWNKPVSQYERYLEEQVGGQREVLVAFLRNEFAGYLTICWQSHYRPFQEANIPEIVDFNVLPQFRKRQIGTRLMDAAEKRCASVSAVVGIGVGMTVDYGAAQIMYARRGYIPDGRGLMAGGHPISYAKTLTVDDDLCLYFTKRLTT